MPEPRWLGRLAVDEAHFRQIRDHGGAHGLRDESALESAVARPRDRWSYDDNATLADLAAAYAYGLSRNHAYVDGNKRIALVAMVAFLDRNGSELTATNEDAVRVMLAVAAGDMAEAALSDWIAGAAIPSPPGSSIPRQVIRTIGLGGTVEVIAPPMSFRGSRRFIS